MDSVDYTRWVVDTRKKIAKHECGMIIKFYGKPGTDDFGGSPCLVPGGVTIHQQARLIRFGYCAFIDQFANSNPSVSNTGRKSPDITVKNKWAYSAETP